MGYRNCVVCGTDTGKIGNVKFCSDECKKQSNNGSGMAYSSREAKKRANDKYTSKNKDKLRMIKMSYRLRLKYKVLLHYSSGDVPTCERCGETDIDCLVLDHINDDGKSDREKMGINGRGTTIGAGSRSYEKYSANGYPEGLQVLCANCNTKKELVRKRSLKISNPFFEQYITNDKRLSWLKKW